MNAAVTCACGFHVEGEVPFVEEHYKDHLLHCRDRVATVSQQPEGAALVRRAIADVAGTNTALRSRLQAAAADLQASGFSPVEIADRLTSGESVE